MADNIKIVGNIINTTTVSRYSSEDTNLISSRNLAENFGGTNDYIEYYTYDAGGNLLNTTYNYLSYKLPPSTGLTPGTTTTPNTTGNIQTTNVGVDSTLSSPTSSLYPIIEIDPVKDLQDLGYSSGEFNVKYNFFQNILSNYIDEALFIKEISSDRTEVRLASVSLTNDEIESVVNNMIDEINNSSYYVDFLLNFGNNEQYVAINIALNKATTGYEVLFKLYQPLPLSVQEKMTLWVVTEKVNPYIFDVNLDKLVTPAPPPVLRGPNFGIEIPDHGTVSTAYTNYNTLVSGLQSLQQSSYQQILNLLATQSIDINVDYTDFNNFIFFSSAYQRSTNFYTKAKQIEDYNNLIATYSPQTSSVPSLITEINKYSTNINNTISQFDGYEYYLYFESSSYAWPKSGSIKPYTLKSTGSTEVITWYNNLTGSSEEYDAINNNNLIYAVPSFLKENDTNLPFLTFLSMVGHYFDNIWIYLQAITDINVANNNLEYGISKDLVYYQLKSLGLHLYNSQAGENINQNLIGANTGSSLFPYTPVVGNDFTVTGSYLNNLPRKDLVAELYKRIYHNLPLLLKQKGTVEGLENLISIFGIPSRTYYVSGSETFYTPTGSNFTASILNVKEFGGSLKSGLIKGYNDDKVRIIPNTISGSVLSPIRSLQTYPTASAEFRENDIHYVDISFSPQTQIDTYISKSISSSNATWSLDDYIGDPRQQYSTTYSDLDTQRKLYYQTGVSGYPGFTGSLLDYNGFIRLIQYFDNSLFKMLADFVPERASLSTGVTINSPVLERNKASYANPTNSTTQSVLTATYQTSSISPQYGSFYNAIQGNKSPFFTGELSGSEFDIYHYFTEANYNPYLNNWDVYNSQHNSTQSIDQNSFLHSDFNVLLNNVSQSIPSIYRQGIEYIWGTTGSIFTSAQLQDSYLTLRSYNISRYEGSKTTSLLYNTYSPATESYAGDDSYGKTAALDHTVRKIGLFTQIESSSYLPKRNTVRLKYLVDEYGNLTELNQINKHWCDVQRTFIMGDTGSVSLFDNKKFGNQKSTDGQKLIFDSGYTYAPVLYGTGYDTRLYFDHTGDSPTYEGIANFFSSSYYISGSSTLGYPIANIGGIQRVSRLYNNVVEEPDNMDGGTSTKLPAYTIPEGGAYQINANATVTMKNTGRYGSASFTLQLYKGAATYGTSDTQVFTFTQPATTYNVYTTPYLFTNATSINYSTIVTSNRIITATNGAGYSKVFPVGSQFYKFSQEFYTVFNAYPSCNVGGVTISAGDGYVAVSPPAGYASTLPATLSQPSTQNGCNFGIPLKRASTSFYIIHMPGFSTPVGEQTVTKTFSVSFRSPTTLTAGNTISASLNVDYIQSTISPYYTASIVDPDNSKFKVTALANIAGNYPYTTLEYFADSENSDIALNSNQLAFTPGVTSFYSPGYQFLPSWTSGSRSYTSSLYDRYGDVDYPFQLGPMDIFSAYDISGSYFETRITNVEKVTGTLGSNQYIVLTFADDVPETLGSTSLGGNGQLVALSVAKNKPAQFLFLARIQDETNAYLKFRKRPGQTSYGFLIPENLSPDVLAKIDTITKEVKQKLISDQSSQITIGDLTGGGF
jgi:hypothetical protein